MDAQHYDLVVEKDGKFSPVQVKMTTQLVKARDGSQTKVYALGLRNVKTNTKSTVVRKRQNGDYDLLFVMCGNGDCYSIPATELPVSGTTLGPKYQQYKLMC